MPFEVVFYRTLAGGSPVLDWLKRLSKEARSAIGSDLRRAQTFWPKVTRPHVGSLKEGLSEVRSTSQRVEYRLVFGVIGNDIVVLHGFVKKTQTIPAKDMAIARDRWTEVRANERQRPL